MSNPMNAKENRQGPDLTNGAQDQFWSSVSPDIREALELFENGEDWTYEYDEFPELFIATANMLPDVLELPVKNGNKEILINLIPLLSSMPFRQAIAALAWIDNQELDGPGWGAACFAEATKITNQGPGEDNPVYLHAKMLCDRVKTLVRFNMVSTLFLNNKEFG